MDRTRQVGRGRSVVFAISADYERRTGGWAYGAAVCRGLRERGWTILDLTLPAGFPDPDACAREGAAAAFAALPDGTIALVDQLCVGVLPELAAREAGRLRLVMIVHHPLALELGRPEEERRRLAASERASLEHAALALTTSRTTAAILAADYGVPPSRLVTAPPGVERKPLARGGGGDGSGPLRLLSVGAVVPRKDYGTLVEALGGLADRSWRLTVVGNRTRAAAHAARLEARIAELGLRERVALAGERGEEELASLWAAADLYVSASTFEGYGMAIAEALAAGLPVVTTAAGAVSEWLDPRASVVVPVGDVAALRAAIEDVLDRPARLAELRTAALAAREGLPTWEECVATIDTALGGL